MNTIGVAMVWCVVQVTLVSLFVGGLYLLARWLRPAAAASIVLAGLVAVVILSILTLSPWPRWAFMEELQSPAASAVASVPARQSVDLEEYEQETSAAPQLPRLASEGLLRQVVGKELFDLASADSATGWRWPALLAVALFAGMLGRLAWLVLGMLAVRWQRRNSRPVNDRGLSELIDVLCAELRCRRPIEVRQSGNLVTAAMIGWRRPVLLLPPDWRTWNEDERRAVLAHEIAHARSHDCLTLLCGQLALMLHIYHPLLHWLANRLRLEQELWADAAAASVSGGQRQYLVTIAELALRQHDRPLVWPARTFLPTRTTFLRRIAMLRDNKLPRDRLSPSARLIAVGVVVLGGILVAGLRGPAGQSQAVAAEPARPAKVAKGFVQLGYVGEASTDKRSLGGAGHAVAFHRPAEAKYLTTIQIYASRYGLPQPPQEDFHVYVLDEDQKMLRDFLFPYAIIERGQETWYELHVAATEVPEDFYIALSFNTHQTKGIYLGLDRNVETSHSYIGLPGVDLSPVPQKYDWMVRAFVTSDAKKVRTRRGPNVGRLAPSAPAKDAAQIMQQGWKLWQNGQTQQAAEQFREAVKLAPDDANAWNGLGWASFNSGKALEAQKAFERVVVLNPNHPAGLNGLGQLCLMQRKYDQAEKFLLKAGPDAPAAWYGLTKLYLLQGKFDKAEKWAQKIVDSSGADNDGQRLLRAAKEKHLDEELRSLIEPPPSASGPSEGAKAATPDAKRSLPKQPGKSGVGKGMEANSAATTPIAPRDPGVAVKEAVEKISTMSEVDPQLSKVLESLKRLDQDQVVTETAKFLDSKEDNMRRAAIYILWRGGFSSIEPAVPQLLRLCAHDEDLTRGMAALALGGNHVGKSLAVLTKMTTDDASGYARRCGAIALGFLGNKEATATLKKALKDPESMVRNNAQAALRMLDRTSPAAQPTAKEEHADARRQALAAARAWLVLTDEGKYAESWEAAAGYLKKAVGKGDFVKSLEAARSPLGKMISREVESEQFSTRLPGAPEGQYVVIQFKTSLANAKSAVETVTPMLDKDGQWRVSGYYIK